MDLQRLLTKALEMGIRECGPGYELQEGDFEWVADQHDEFTGRKPTRAEWAEAGYKGIGECYCMQPYAITLKSTGEVMIGLTGERLTGLARDEAKRVAQELRHVWRRELERDGDDLEVVEAAS